MDVTTDTPSPLPARRPAIIWAGRLTGILFGCLIAWLLVEVLLRVMFFSLPPRLQLVLDDLHVTPFSDRKLMPNPIWQPDNEFLTITRPVNNREQFGSAEVRFHVTTETLWGRPAFRTTNEQVGYFVDAVAVGDSFTFCFTERDDCWVDQLGGLTGRNIVNLGITSTGSVSHLRVLEQFAQPLAPPLVVWQWYGNDANEDYGLALLDPRLQTDGMPPQDDTAPPAPALSWWDKNSAIYVLIKLFTGSEDDYDASLQFLDREEASRGDIDLAFGRTYLWGAFDMTRPQNQYGWELSREALRQTQTVTTGFGGSLVVVLMPTKEQAYRDMAEPLLGADRLALLDRSYELMLDFCDSEGLTCIDPLPTFQAHAADGEQLFYKTDIHLNPRGNEVLAGLLAEWLAEHPEIFAAAP